MARVAFGSPTTWLMNGSLSISLKRRSDRTVLASSRSTLPLQMSKSMELDGSDAAYVMLLNPTGGLLSGDCLTTNIELAKNAHAVLTTTSATKVYRAESGAATHRTTLSLREGAVVEYLPDHVIPHPGSWLDQSLLVQLEPSSRAIILDGFAVGRVARQEQWLFKELKTEIAVTRSGQAIFRDTIRIRPETWIPSGLGGTEGAKYSATMLLCGDTDINWQGTANTFACWFRDQHSCSGAASTLAHGGCVVRYLTYSAHALDQVTKALWAMARSALLSQPPLHLRKQ